VKIGGAAWQKWLAFVTRQGLYLAMHLTRFLGIVCAAALILAGCASVGKNFDSRRINEIEKGKTTEADLVAMFGEPNNRGQNSSGVKTLMWIYSEARMRGETFIPIAGAFVGGSDVKSKSLFVTLSPDGTVSDYNFSGGGTGIARGVQDDPEKAPSKAK
jgi:hypothetical protein